jgi:hypothetical protein
MRCFFMQAGHIAAVELLENISGDEAAIARCRSLFVTRVRLGYDGFELWDRARRVYCYPEPCEDTPPSGDHHPSGLDSIRR